MGREYRYVPRRSRAPDLVATRLTGLKTRSVFDRHDITSPGDLREAARKLDPGARPLSREERRAGELASW